MSRRVTPNDLEAIKRSLYQNKFVLNNFIGRGGLAEVYSATSLKDDDEYVVRIVSYTSVDKSRDEIYEDFRKRDTINRKLSKEECDSETNANSKVCKIACINKHIVCSDFLILSQGKYFVEVMKKYDMDLGKHIRVTLDSEIHDNNDRLFYNLSLKNASTSTNPYTENFLTTILALWNALLDLHKNGMAHGDIKPENILARFNPQDDNLIDDVAISDFDTLCTEMMCAPSGHTDIFATRQLLVSHKNDKFDIKIKQQSDIFAMALTTMILWYGMIVLFDEFSHIFKTIDPSGNHPTINEKGYIFVNDVYSLYKSPKVNKEQERLQFYNMLMEWNKQKFSQLPRTMTIFKIKRIIDCCIKIIVDVMDDKDVNNLVDTIININSTPSLSSPSQSPREQAQEQEQSPRFNLRNVSDKIKTIIKR